LGSCVGIGIYDPISHVGALLHAVLPKCNNATDPTPAKYVDTGVKMLLDQVVQAGALKNRLIIRMAGGANILNSPSLSATFDIGNRNIQAARIALQELGLKTVNEEVGGQTGRTVRLYVATGKMTIRMMGEQEREF
jgi:chemotaxis protein CheD